MKRGFDFFVSALGLTVLSPLFLFVIILVWVQDFRSPFYVAARMRKGSGQFRMIKLRSMVINAASSGVNSTSIADRRITPIGHFIRRFKLDEMMQLWNVLKGDMSLVGPRPQVEIDALMYTEMEKRMLTVRPGITDFASIVFSDEGSILGDSDEPDLKYNQIIRPWKSRLALFYIENRTFLIDVKIIVLTAVAVVSRKYALKGVVSILKQLNADDMLICVSTRQESLRAYPPPGAREIVGSYPMGAN